jgi:hypothetical protein
MIRMKYVKIYQRAVNFACLFRVSPKGDKRIITKSFLHWCTERLLQIMKEDGLIASALCRANGGIEEYEAIKSTALL